MNSADKNLSANVRKSANFHRLARNELGQDAEDRSNARGRFALKTTTVSEKENRENAEIWADYQAEEMDSLREILLMSDDEFWREMGLEAPK